jgi:hypothetical protein
MRMLWRHLSARFKIFAGFWRLLRSPSSTFIDPSIKTKQPQVPLHELILFKSSNYARSSNLSCVALKTFSLSLAGKIIAAIYTSWHFSFSIYSSAGESTSSTPHRRCEDFKVRISHHDWWIIEVISVCHLIRKHSSHRAASSSCKKWFTAVSLLSFPISPSLGTAAG